MNKKLVKNIMISLILAFILLNLTGCIIDNKKTDNNKNVEENGNANANNGLIVSEMKYEEDTNHYLIIKKLDKDEKVVWTYTTAKDFVGQYENIELLGENNDIVYVNELGTVTALDRETGKVLWKNNEYKGYQSLCTLDYEGYLYLTSESTPYLFVVSPEGKTVAKINQMENNDIHIPTNTEIIDKYTLKATYISQVTEDLEVTNELFIDIRDLKNDENVTIAKEIAPEFNQTSIYGFSDIKNFKLDENGTASIVFQATEELTEKYPEGTLELATNVKNISPLLWGNSGYGTLVIVRKDGTVAVLDSMNAESGNYTIRELNVTNIDYAFELSNMDGQAYGLVDKDGNITIYRV